MTEVASAGANIGAVHLPPTASTTTTTTAATTTTIAAEVTAPTPAPDVEESVEMKNAPETTTKAAIQDSSDELDALQERGRITTVEQAASNEPAVDHVPAEKMPDRPSGDKVEPRGAEVPAEQESKVRTEGAAAAESERVESSSVAISQEEQQQLDTVDTVDTTNNAAVAAAVVANAESDASAEAKKAYELAHVRQNEEVVFATPTDEEIKEACSSFAEDVVPDSERADKTEKLEVSSVDGVAETREQPDSTTLLPPSEPGIESLSSIPTETGTQLVGEPSSVPEEGKEEESQDTVSSVLEGAETGHKDEIQAKHEEPDAGIETKQETEVVSTATAAELKGEETDDVQEEAGLESGAGMVDTTAGDAKETPAAVEREHEAVIEGGPVDEATSAESALITEGEDRTQSKDVVGEAPEPGDLSKDTAAPAPEETAEECSAAQTGDVDARSEKAEEAVSGLPAADESTEVALDDSAGDPSKEVGQPEEEASVEHPVETMEPTEPANVVLETPVSETDVADVQEMPSGETAASDVGKVVEESREVAEVSLTAPTETETVVESVVATSTEEVVSSQEPTPEQAQEQPAIAKDNEGIAQAIDETPDVEAKNTAPAEPSEVTVTEVESKPEGAVTDEVGSEVVPEDLEKARRESVVNEVGVSESIEKSVDTEPAASLAAGMETHESIIEESAAIEDAGTEAKKACELVYVRQNDEVVFATPIDEETKAACSDVTEDVVPDSERTDKTENPEVPYVDGVTEAEPETREQPDSTTLLPSSEPGVESLSSVPTETGTQQVGEPSSVPEEHKEEESRHVVSSVPEEVEAEHKDKVQVKHEEPDLGTETKQEPDAVSTATAPDLKGEETADVQEEAGLESGAGMVDTTAGDAKETPATVEREHEAVVEGGLVDETTSAEPALTTEQEDRMQAKDSVSAKGPEPGVLDNEKSLAEDVPSTPEETTEVCTAEQTGSVDARSEKAEEVVSDLPAVDESTEVALDDKAGDPSKEVGRPEEEASVEHPVEAVESTEPANVVLETSVSETNVADVRETPSGEIAANDAGKVVEESREVAEVSLTAPTETETAVESVVATSTEEAMPSQEPTPDNQHVEANTTPAERTEVTVTEAESKPEDAVTDEVGSEVVPEALEKARHESAVNEVEGVSESNEKSVDAESTALLAAGTEAHESIIEESTAIEGAGTDTEATVDNSAVEEKVEEAVSATRDDTVLQNDGDTTTSEEAKPVEHATEVAQGSIPQPEGQEAGAAGSVEANESATVVGSEETEDVTVPDVQVETPTPMSENLEISSDEDEADADVPLESRLAKAAGIPPEVLTKILWTPPTTQPETSTSTHDSNDSVTPIQTKGEENVSGESGVKDAAPGLETEDLETPSQSMFLERPQQDTDTTAAEPALDTNVTEAPEGPKSPWTPSYSVTTQGLAPAHPDKPLEEIISEKAVDVQSEGMKFVKEEPTETVQTEEATSLPPGTVEECVSEEVPSAPAVVVQDAEPIAREESVLDAAIPQEKTPAALQEDLARELASVSEEQEVKPPVEIIAEDTTGAVDVEAKTKPSIDTNVADVPERPRSPWTPSYSVTKMGPGVREPEDLHLDPGTSAESKGDAVPGEVLQGGTEEPAVPSEHEVVGLTEAPEAAPTMEHPKGFEDTTPSPIWASAAASVADSNEPEAPSSPRSELGAITPGFDSRSEVSEASHIPIPPESPRTDPDAASFSDAEVKTPLVASAEDQRTPVSPLQTPLLSADKVVEAVVAPEALTESAVSYINVDVENSMTTGSWVKDTDNERESNVVADLPLSNDAHSVEASKGSAVLENDVSANVPEGTTVEEAGAQAQATERVPMVPELRIPKLDIKAPTPTVQPIPVVNTLSADSAYTQISEGLSPSQETGTNATTPDVESSDQPWSTDSTVRALSRTGSKGKSLGIAHTLAMRTFPSAFADTEGPSTSGQTQQSEPDSLEENDQLSPLSARRRLESTVSSLAFPGGWVSSPSHKERASLETAAGEFSKPVVSGATPILVTEPESEQKESKWRCIIM